MATDNTITLIGNLTDDPELRFTADAYQHVTPALEEQAAATVARLVFGP